MRPNDTDPASPGGGRNSRGEWRPPEPIKYAPLFKWPPKPGQVVKWIFSYPGFLWPWNSVYLFTAILTWLYLQPPLEQCKEFHWQWILIMFIRNLGLLWVFAGGWHLILYTLKLQGTERKYDARWPKKKDPKFLFSNQVWDNIFWSCTSGCFFWTAYEVLYMWSAANNYVPLVSLTEHPIYCAVWMCLIPFWREFHFYWVHRLIHWKPLYKRIHYLHHKNVNPGPWSGLAMHPIEHLLYFSGVLIHWVVPSHPIHLLFNSQHASLAPAGGHIGFEGPLFDEKVPAGSYFHYLHHRYFECNYGDATLPLDKYFGTFRDGSPDGAGATLSEEHK